MKPTDWLDNLIPLNLSLFNEEKTEEATSKKKTDARKEGQVAVSQEISTAVSLILGFGTIGMFAVFMYNQLTNVFFTVFALLEQFNYVSDPAYIVQLVGQMFGQAILISLPLLLIMMVAGIAVSLIQVGWAPTGKPLKPKFSKLNPIKGFKKIFGMQSLVNLFKSLFKITIIGIVIYITLNAEAENVQALMQMSLVDSFAYIGGLIAQVGLTVGAWFIFIAAADTGYTRYKHKKDLRMSKQEVKDEHKQSEGNPQIKGAIRQKMREAGMRRMMQDIPTADVVITNPTHYAVAVSYDRSGISAPKVVAKGVDHMAKRIRDIADEHKVERVENVQLARTLYATVEVGQEIPPELFQAVAEVLAYVYKLKNLI